MAYGNIIADYNTKNAASLKKYTNEYNNKLSDVKKLIKDEEGKTELLGFSNIITDYTTLIEDGLKNAEQNNFKKVQEISVDLLNKPFLIIENVKNLVSIELKYFNSEIIKINNNINIFGIVIIMIIIIIFILGIFISVIFSNMLTNPIINVSNSLKEISEGEGDFTKKMETVSNDEVGLLSGYFNKFILSLSNIIKRINILTEETRKIGANLASSSDETTSGLEEIRINVENIKNKAIYLDNEIMNSNKLTFEVKNLIGELNNDLLSQSNSIADSSDSVKLMLSSIGNLSKNSKTKFEVSRILLNTAIEGEKIIQNTIYEMENVDNSANFIMDIFKNN